MNSKIVRCGLLTIMLGAAVCTAAPAQTRPLTPVSVAFVGVADCAPIVYAMQQGWFEQAGLDVKLTTMGSGAVSISALIGGAVDIAVSNVLTAISARARGIPITLIAPLGRYDAARPTTELLVLRDSPIHTAKDLEGRTVAVTSLSDIASIGLRVWMASEGADPAKVQMIESVQTTMLATLEAKRIDAFVASQPVMTVAEASGQTRMLAAPYDAINKQFVTDGVFSDEKWLATHRDIALKFSATVGRATAYGNAHYDQMIPIISSFSKLTPEMLHNMIQIKGALAPNAADLQPVIDAAAKFGVIQNAFPAKDMLLVADRRNSL